MSSQNNGTKDAGFSEKLDIPGLSGSFSLVKFILKEAPEKLWDAYFILSETIYREFNQKGRLPNRETLKRLLAVEQIQANTPREALQQAYQARWISKEGVGRCLAGAEARS